MGHFRSDVVEGLEPTEFKLKFTEEESSVDLECPNPVRSALFCSRVLLLFFYSQSHFAFPSRSVFRVAKKERDTSAMRGQVINMVCPPDRPPLLRL